MSSSNNAEKSLIDNIKDYCKSLGNPSSSAKKSSAKKGSSKKSSAKKSSSKKSSSKNTAKRNAATKFQSLFRG